MKSSSTIFGVLLIAAASSVVLTCPKQPDNILHSSNDVDEESRRSVKRRYIHFRDSKTDDFDFLWFDHDADGFVDPCEFMMRSFYYRNSNDEYTLKDFVNADTNGDDRLSSEEFSSMKSTVTRKDEGA